MSSEIFSRNLRRLRMQKKMTQEQTANALGVSVQSVSRWECGNTLPDVMLLPELARIYGITVDDLYQDDVQGYPSYAQRLLAVYEATGRTADFLAAEQEFSRINPSQSTADDLRAWGVLYHYMMQHSARQARQKLEQAMEHAQVTEQVLLSAAQQRIALLCDLGKGQEATTEYDRKLSSNPGNPLFWVLCTAAHEYTGEYTLALDVAKKGLERFPDNAALYVHAGDICRSLKRYNEAFAYWNNSLKLDSGFMDTMYSMGFCYEELGQYDKAHRVWTEVTQELDRRGLLIERKFPAQMAENCLRKM